jgi:hypothetical protein
MKTLVFSLLFKGPIYIHIYMYICIYIYIYISWWLVHVHLKQSCLLLLSSVSYKCHIGELANSVCQHLWYPCWFSTYFINFWMRSVYISKYNYGIVFLLIVQSGLLHVRWSYVIRYRFIKTCNIFMNWPLHHSECFLFPLFRFWSLICLIL